MSKFKIIFVFSLIILAIITVFQKPTKLGLDLQGGMHLILEAQETENTPLTKDAVLGSLEVIRNRVDAIGLSEPIIQLKGDKQIIVELPGISNPEEAKKMIGDTALLEFIEGEWAPPGIENLSEEKQKILTGDQGTLSFLKKKDPQGKILSQVPIILKETALSGSDLKEASPGTDEYGRPLVNISFSQEGSKKFYNITKKNTNKPLAIVLDGTIISAPNIKEPINGGRAQISGNFSLAEVKNLVIKLNAGALPTPVEIISEKTVGPTLGKNSIDKSKVAFLVGFVGICIFMILCYKVAGILASIALICYILLSLACFKLFNATLTLPGIAGFILTMGMAVDANVIIFERIKEELKTEAIQKKAILKGFDKAYLTILDANITTLIAALVLFWLGTGTIKGFAITLSIGILVSMFSAITITQMLLLSTNKYIFFKKGTQ